MKLAAKMTHTIVACAVIIFAALLAYVNFVVLRRYENLDRRLAIERVEGLRLLVGNELEHLAGTLGELAASDDAYGFVRGTSDRIVREDVDRQTRANLGVEIVAVADTAGAVRLATYFDEESGRSEGVPVEVLAALKSGVVVKGFVVTRDGAVFAVAGAPVTNNRRSAAAIGRLCLGTRVSSAVIGRWMRLTGRPLALALDTLTADTSTALVSVSGPDTQYATLRVRDLHGRPAFRLTTPVARVAIQCGRVSVRGFLVTVALFLVVLTLVMLFVVRRSVVAPIERLRTNVEGIVHLDDLTKRVPIESADELGNLATNVNMMLSRMQGASASVRGSEARYRRLFEDTAVLHVYVDESLRVHDINESGLRMLGYGGKDELVGTSFLDIVDSEDRMAAQGLVNAGIKGGGFCSAELQIRSKAGDVCVFLFQPTERVHGESGSNLVLLSGTNITVRKALELRIQEQATRDPLTSTLNRRVGLEMLAKYMSRAKRNREALAVCFVDVDGLKKVNDTLGHSVGDTLIGDAAEVLRNSLRESDVTCRLGGDEFLLILPQCTAEQFKNAWKRVLDNAESHCVRNGRPYRISLSHGVAEFTGEDPLTADQLVAIADALMYAEKHQRRAVRITHQADDPS